MKNALAVVTLIIAAYLLTPTTAAGQQAEDNDVVKITTKLVQVDVVVTDKDGNQVPDLTADDFVLVQDGRTQKITGITYVSSSTELPPPSPPKKTEKNAIAPPPVKIRPAGAKRVITFVVDDGNCIASISGMTASREGIEKFIREQMLTGDMVAIYRTRGGTSMMQQYTSDKTQLLAAAKKIRWQPAMGTCGTDGTYYEAARINTIELPGKSLTVETAENRARREHIEDANRNNQIVGSIGVLTYVIRGLQEVPGRKIVFFISDGLPLVARNGEFLDAKDVLRDVTELANRASVVVNTIDDRGLFDTSIIEARDEIATRDNERATNDVADVRSRDVQNSRHGLLFLANETGGRFYEGQNLLDKPISQALRREKGYYLIAYEPDEATFKSKTYNKIDVRVERPGLNVFSRSGFLPVASASQKPKKKTGDSELYEAIMAPIPKPGLSIQLSAYFVNSAPGVNVVRATFHVDGAQVSFLDAPGGRKRAMLDVVAVTLNEKNDVIDEFTRTHDFNIEAADLPSIRKNGLVYSTDVPVKKAGTYNFRVAVRDGVSKNLGSAIQILQVPDVKKAELVVSGLAMTGVDAAGKFEVPGPVPVENAISLPGSTAVPSVRRFRRGTVVAFPYTIYNARLAGGKPKLTIQMNLFHDGEMILEGKPAAADLEAQNDWSRIKDYGRILLNPKSVPGDYALQLIVTDLLADGKKGVTSQWIDFEIVE